MVWTVEVKPAMEYFRNKVAEKYNQLPSDNAALSLKAKFGISCNAGGFAAGAHSMIGGDFVGGLARMLAPALSSSGDAVGLWTARVNSSRHKSEPDHSEQKNGLLEWALRNPLLVNYLPKMAGALSFVYSGLQQDNFGYVASGSMYFFTNMMKGMGHRGMLLTSTALSATSGMCLAASGVHNKNFGDVVSGVSSVAIAVLMSRIRPQNLPALARI